jgi:hypothetical protein
MGSFPGRSIWPADLRIQGRRSRNKLESLYYTRICLNILSKSTETSGWISNLGVEIKNLDLPYMKWEC